MRQESEVNALQVINELKGNSLSVSIVVFLLTLRRGRMLFTAQGIDPSPSIAMAHKK